MFAAASKKGGAGGVTQAVGADFANADPGGELPAKVKDGKPVGSKPQSLFRSKQGS